jgi:enediyne biosynthesis protein E4
VPHVKWGGGLVDFDNDGHRDVFYALGHLQDTIELSDRTTGRQAVEKQPAGSQGRDPGGAAAVKTGGFQPWKNVRRTFSTTSYAVRNVVLRGDGRGSFRDVSDSAGSGLVPVKSSRGAAFDDLDDDGRVDAAITNARDRPTIIRNVSPGGHWLQLRLVGTRSNRDAIGARVEVEAGSRRQVAEVAGGRGYQGHFGSRLSFGLGEAARVERVRVRWPAGGTTVLEDVAADRLLLVVEPAAAGAGPAAADPGEADHE